MYNLFKKAYKINLIPQCIGVGKFVLKTFLSLEYFSSLNRGVFLPRARRHCSIKRFIEEGARRGGGVIYHQPKDILIGEISKKMYYTFYHHLLAKTS